MDAIYFDLDGTLTDPKPGITGSIQYALEKLERPVPSQDELAWCIGPPLRASFVTLLGGEERADRAVELYRERFSDVGLFENHFFARALPSRLFASLSRPTDDHTFAERIEAIDEHAPKAVAISNEQRDGCDSPHNPKHGE